MNKTEEFAFAVVIGAIMLALASFLVFLLVLGWQLG